jgi:CubicO group peptidase (beta-lactamase class C family)
MKKNLFFILAATLFTTVASAQVNSVPDSLEQIVQKWMPPLSDNTPGFSTIVVADGKTIYKKMVGSANLEMSVPIKEQTLFNIGSTSKQFTAFLILLLEEEGKLNIEDRVNKYLPEYKVFKENPIKIKHLLYHTSGLRELLSMLQLGGWKDDDVYSDYDNKYLLNRQTGLNFTPGTMRQYINTNYLALALIIEHVSRKKFSEFCKETIFTPLQMTTAIVADNHQAIIPNRATGYNTFKAEGRIIYTPSDDWYGHGGIYCTISDLKKWADNFTQQKIGSANLYKKFFSKGAFDNGKGVQDYGYGWFHFDYKGITDLEHDGARLGFRTGLIFFPGKKTFIITLCNARDISYTALREKIADYIFKGHFPSAQKDNSNTIPPLNPITRTENQLNQYQGMYWDRAGDQIRNIYLKNGTLYADNLTLIPEQENLFRVKDGENITGSKVQFYRKPGNVKWQMNYVRGRNVSFKSDNSFSHEWVDSVKNLSLTEFNGAYYSDELDAKFEIRNQKNYLELNIRGYEHPIKMQPVFKDYFNSDFGGIYFQRDLRGTVKNFILITAKVNNVLFKKIIFN